jgi:hypothetical protein
MPKSLAAAVLALAAACLATPAPAADSGVPPAQPQAVAVPADVLARYVGRYRVSPDVEAVITLEDGRLYGALTGRPKHELLARSQTEFVAADADARIVFELGPDGRATGAALTVGDQVVDAPRIAEP